MYIGYSVGHVNQTRGIWSAPEDTHLHRLVQEHGVGNWTKVASGFDHRSSKQCRERWSNILDPTLKKTPWEAEEDALLKYLQGQHGNRWTRIAQDLAGRAENEVKNRWNSAAFKRSIQNLSPTLRARIRSGDMYADTVTAHRQSAGRLRGGGGGGGGGLYDDDEKDGVATDSEEVHSPLEHGGDGSGAEGGSRPSPSSSSVSPLRGHTTALDESKDDLQSPFGPPVNIRFVQSDASDTGAGVDIGSASSAFTAVGPGTTAADPTRAPNAPGTAHDHHYHYGHSLSHTNAQSAVQDTSATSVSQQPTLAGVTFNPRGWAVHADDAGVEGAAGMDVDDGRVGGLGGGGGGAVGGADMPPEMDLFSDSNSSGGGILMYLPRTISDLSIRSGSPPDCWTDSLGASQPSPSVRLSAAHSYGHTSSPQEVLSTVHQPSLGAPHRHPDPPHHANPPPTHQVMWMQGGARYEPTGLRGAPHLAFVPLRDIHLASLRVTHRQALQQRQQQVPLAHSPPFGSPGAHTYHGMWSQSPAPSLSIISADAMSELSASDVNSDDLDGLDSVVEMLTNLSTSSGSSVRSQHSGRSGKGGMGERWHPTR